MSKRNLGFIVAVLAIIGGFYALYNFINGSNTNKQVVTNDQGAAQFASAFLHAYFSYSKEDGFDSITPFTNLDEKRKLGDPLIQSKVLSISPIEVHQLAPNYFQTKSIIHLKQYYYENLETKKEKVEEKFYQSVVYVTKTPNGFEIEHYPSISLFTKDEDQKPPYPAPVKDEEANKQMKAMLDTFFKSYFSSSSYEEIQTFFAVDAGEVMPLSNSLEYVSLEDFQAFGEKAPWIVYATVKAREKGSGFEFNLTFEVSIVYDNRFVIQEISH